MSDLLIMLNCLMIFYAAFHMVRGAVRFYRKQKKDSYESGYRMGHLNACQEIAQKLELHKTFENIKPQMLELVKKWANEHWYKEKPNG